jgi:hypothetical protein
MHKIAYAGWMIVYLFSLPIWNGILPALTTSHRVKHARYPGTNVDTMEIRRVNLI